MKWQTNRKIPIEMKNHVVTFPFNDINYIKNKAIKNLAKKKTLQFHIIKVS